VAIIAAFYWKKSPRCSISMMTIDAESLKIISPPKIIFLENYSYSLKRNVKKIIKNFFINLIELSQEGNNEINIEYKIVHIVPHHYILKPAKESKYVYDTFFLFFKKYHQYGDFKLNPQLLKFLKGKDLLYFKRKLRYFNLVSRKKQNGHEYSLWMIALNITSLTYSKKINILKQKLLDKFWNEEEN
jgi:hypothetical protein